MLNLNKVVQQLVRQLVYTILITNNHAPFLLWRNRNLVKYQKSLKVLLPRFSLKYSLAFMSLLTTPNVRNSHILAEMHFMSL